MPESAVLYTAEGGVATLTMNRPQVLNALNDDLLNGLRDGLARAKADAAVRGEIENAWHARAARVLLVRWELPDEVLAAACDFTLSPDPMEAKADGSLADVLLAARYLVNVGDPADLAGAAFPAAAPFARLRLDARDVGEILTVSAAEITSLHAALA